MADREEAPGARYVIQRASESCCEWWTGTGWTQDDRQAMRYIDEPRAEDITGEENATAQLISAAQFVEKSPSRP
jgi:hypothetical protein